jgi:hypothetical protein
VAGGALLSPDVTVGVVWFCSGVVGVFGSSVLPPELTGGVSAGAFSFFLPSQGGAAAVHPSPWRLVLVGY